MRKNALFAGAWQKVESKKPALKNGLFVVVFSIFSELFRQFMVNGGYKKIRWENPP